MKDKNTKLVLIIGLIISTSSVMADCRTKMKTDYNLESTSKTLDDRKISNAVREASEWFATLKDEDNSTKEISKKLED